MEGNPGYLQSLNLLLFRVGTEYLPIKKVYAYVLYTKRDLQSYSCIPAKAAT